MLSQASRVYEYVEDRRYVGELVNPSSVGRSSIEGQPPRTTLYLRIEEGLVREARFQTSGCGYLVASCGALIELAIGRTLQACRAITELQIFEHLGGLPEPRRYCAGLAIAALRDALDQWASAQAQESAA